MICTFADGFCRVEASVGRVVQPLAVEWHVGDAAASLAAFLGVARLPGAVLIPPFCDSAKCGVRRCGCDAPGTFRLTTAHMIQERKHHTLLSQRQTA